MPSWDLLGISGCVVVSLGIRLVPLIKGLTTEILLSSVFGTSNAQPISSHDSASMGSIAAVAAKSKEWEKDVSLSFTNKLHAGGGGIGDCVAERIEPAIVAVQSFHLSLGIEPQFAHVVQRGGGIAFNEVLLEAHWPNWCLLCKNCHEYGKTYQQSFHLDIKQ